MEDSSRYRRHPAPSQNQSWFAYMPGKGHRYSHGTSYVMSRSTWIDIALTLSTSTYISDKRLLPKHSLIKLTFPYYTCSVYNNRPNHLSSYYTRKRSCLSARCAEVCRGRWCGEQNSEYAMVIVRGEGLHSTTKI